MKAKLKEKKENKRFVDWLVKADRNYQSLSKEEKERCKFESIYKNAHYVPWLRID